MCAACSEDPTIFHLCPDCGVSVPGGGNSRCRACSNKVALRKELELSAAIYTHEWVATLWRRFGDWLYAQKGSAPNLIKVLRSHQIYFERIDAAFPSVLDLNETSLLRLFGTAMLRLHLLPTRFIAEQLDIRVSEDAKQDAAERARIEDLLQVCKGRTWGIHLQDYLSALDSAGLSLRSLRMYLSTAIQFATDVGLADGPWTQPQMEKFLSRHPGARNNLSRFVSFCRQSKDWDVGMPSKGSLIKPLKDPVKSKLKLEKLIAKANMSEPSAAERHVVEQILATALGMSLKALRTLSLTDLHVTEKGMTLTSNREKIVLPDELLPYGRRLYECLQAGS